jgi:ferrous iron transport protein B
MPIFAPMGIHHDNWPAVISLMTGMLAKEVVIGTLNNLYSQMHQLNHLWQVAVPIDFWQTGQQAFVTMSHHLKILFGLSGDVVETQATGRALPEHLQQYFGSATAAYAYLLFILLYMPCVSTMAAIRQEANRRLMWFSIVWSLCLAYGAAVMFYQIATRLESAQPFFIYLGGTGILVAVLLVSIGGRRALSHS